MLSAAFDWTSRGRICRWYWRWHQPIADDLVAIGEVGLTGEIRSVSHMNQRLGEVARLGFKKCIIPKNTSEKIEPPEGLTVYRVRNLREAIEVAI